MQFQKLFADGEEDNKEKPAREGVWDAVVSLTVADDGSLHAPSPGHKAHKIESVG